MRPDARGGTKDSTANLQAVAVTLPQAQKSCELWRTDSLLIRKCQSLRGKR